MLELKNIQKDYVTASETVHALRGLNLTFRDREFVSILGPSGCGKTTLLNIVGGLDHYTSGDLVINGRSTKSYGDRDWDVYRNHRVGFIFQSYNLIPHQTVLGNVELALTISGVGRAERVERAKRALDRVGLEGQYYKRPNQLSGGQCQRVAIARALVNDPEILLADEPTGALDTKTSVQIMNLIREIAGERLVIMVTHNPELAQRYSTRIISLRDGKVVSDTNPVSRSELRLATKLTAKEKREKKKAQKKKGRENAKMSFFTAFRLSAKNLISKKGRTSMVGIAGSIGIIGIALVLAFSSGIKGYVKSMQDDMLSGNPVSIRETTYDLEAMTNIMSTSDKLDIIKEPGRVYIDSLIEYIAKTNKNVDSMVIKNEITKDYVDYVTAMPSDYYSAMLLGYGMDLSNNIYTNFTDGGGEKTISISALTEIYTSILKSTDFSRYASFINQLVPSFEQAPNNPDYIKEQYDVIGELADEYDEVMLVLNRNDELSDLLLARLGYYTQDEFLNIIRRASEQETTGEYREYFTYEELLSKVFTFYPNDSVFTKNEGNAMRPFNYANVADPVSMEGGVELKVVGILYADEQTTYGCLTSGIYYTEQLTNYVLDAHRDSEIVTYAKSMTDGAIRSMTFNGMKIGIYYDYSYVDYDGQIKNATAFVGSSLANISSLLDSFGSMGGLGGSGGSSGSGGGGSLDTSALTSTVLLDSRMLGGESVPNEMSIYPISFDSKDLVTNYLNAWNGDGNITVGDRVIKAEDRADVSYTDTLELVINLINGMIDVVSAALIAFTSISLVVSTVMIGIITYVSVVERIKEIGVIRSLGGRKKDVSRLFTAETFIIGLLAGAIGIIATYGISYIASAIVYNLIGIPNIAMLEPAHAALLILLSIILTLFSGVMPARSAAKKDPVVALRTE
ncbi:MAG: ABC transporter ATP-binding protein/permease [Clostridia bacterium]|nr:ABC transporter ATP-binding protein/permease [Clostridia bacterium]